MDDTTTQPLDTRGHHCVTVSMVRPNPAVKVIYDVDRERLRELHRELRRILDGDEDSQCSTWNNTLC